MKELTLREKIHMTKLSILASIPTAIAFCNSVVVYAAEATGTNTGTGVTQKINNVSLSLWGTLKLIFMSLILVVLGVCGLMLLIGTSKMKEWVKEHFYSIVMGCMVLFLAKDIAEYLEDTFG